MFCAVVAETNDFEDRLPLVMTEALRSLIETSFDINACDPDLALDYYDFVLDFKIVEKRKQLAGIL